MNATVDIRFTAEAIETGPSDADGKQRKTKYKVGHVMKGISPASANHWVVRGKAEIIGRNTPGPAAPPVPDLPLPPTLPGTEQAFDPRATAAKSAEVMRDGGDGKAESVVTEAVSDADVEMRKVNLAFAVIRDRAISGTKVDKKRVAEALATVAPHLEGCALSEDSEMVLLAACEDIAKYGEVKTVAANDLSDAAVEVVGEKATD